MPDDRPLGDQFPFLRGDWSRLIKDLAWPAEVIATRALEVLRQYNVTVLASLAEMTDEDLLGLRDFGKKSLSALYRAIEASQKEWISTEGNEIQIEL